MLLAMATMVLMAWFGAGFAVARESETPIPAMRSGVNPVGPESADWRARIEAVQAESRKLASAATAKERKKSRMDRSGLDAQSSLALARAAWGPLMQGTLFSGAEPGEGLVVEKQLGGWLGGRAR